MMLLDNVGVCPNCGGRGVHPDWDGSITGTVGLPVACFCSTTDEEEAAWAAWWDSHGPTGPGGGVPHGR